MRLLYGLVGFVLVCSIALLFFTKQKTDTSRKLLVVCTTSIIHDAAQRICGSHVDLARLMGPGIDPHTYKTTPGDMQKLLSADLIFYNGLHLEGKMSELLSSPHLRGRAHQVTQAIPQDRLLCAQQDCAVYDPHIWFDVQLWIHVVQTIAHIMIATDPDEMHQVNYRENARAYIHELTMLDEYLHAKSQQISPAQKIVVTAHDAFHYFGRAYGFQVHALQGISTDSDIGTYDIKILADFIANHRISTIFVESSIAPRGLQAVQQAVRSRGFETRIGPELYSDALGPIHSQAGTYIGMMRYTMDTIVDNLNSH